MNRSNETEAERQLLSAVANGDRTAFRHLYEQTYGRIARYVRNMVKDESLAEDIVVQTYTTVWQTAQRFRGTSRVTTWMIGIARNLALKEFRKSRKEARFDESYLAADEDSQREPERKDRQVQLKGALMALSTKHRETLELVFYQGMTYPEVSEIINVPINTVKTRVFHAKKALRDELAARGITEHDI